MDTEKEKPRQEKPPEQGPLDIQSGREQMEALLEKLYGI